MKNEKRQANVNGAFSRTGRNWTVFLFLVLVICLFYNQWVTLENLSNAINPITRFGTLADFMGFLNTYGPRIFTSSDVFVFVLIVLIPVFLVTMEIRRKWLTNIIESLPKREGTVILLLAFVSLVCMRYYFASGTDMYSGDSPYHIFLIREMAHNLRNFVLFPYWTFMYGGGTPFLQFYGSLHPMVGGILYLFTGSLSFAVKFSLFLFHFASVIGVYLFIRELSGSRRAGVISAVAAILMYFHPHLMLFPGRYGEAAIWAVYPFLFYFFERLIKEKKLVWSLSIAVCVAFLVFASIGMSFYFFLFFGIYVAVRLLSCGQPWKERSKLLVLAVFSGVLGLVLSSYYLYGQIVESKWTIAQVFGAYKTPTIEQGIFLPLFLWNNYQISLFKFDFAWQSAYFGITLIVLSLIGALMSFKRRHADFLPLAVLLGVIVFLLIGYGRIGWLMKIPYLHTYSQSRLLNILAFMVIFLAGPGALWLLGKAHWSPRVFSVILILIFIDLFPTTFHDSFGKRYGDSAAPIFERLEAEASGAMSGVPVYRADLIGPGNQRAIQGNWRAYDAFMAETGMPLVCESAADYKRTREFYNFFVQELYLNQVNLMDVLDMHFLFNCRYILSSVPLPRSAFRTYSQNGDSVLAEMPFLTPVITTSKISNGAFTTNDIVPFFHKVRIDMQSGTASCMWTVNGVSTNLGTKPAPAEILEHVIGRSGVRLKIRTVSDTFAVLSYSAYPTLRAFVNGKPARIFETIYGFMVVRLGAGENTVLLKPSRTRQSAFFFTLALCLFLAVGTYVVIYFLRKKNRGQEVGK